MDMNSDEWRTTDLLVDEELLERMVMAVEKVRERLHRATVALEAARIPYAVVGRTAVAAWVGRVDESAVRNTQDVDILLRRVGPGSHQGRLLQGGLRVHSHVEGIDLFLDGPNAKARDAVRVIFAGEKIRADDIRPAPE